MDRRSTIKSVAGLGIGTPIIGSIGIVSARSTVQELERYTREVIDRHGIPTKASVGLRNEDGEVETVEVLKSSNNSDPHTGEEELVTEDDLSTLFKESVYSSVILAEFNDGHIVKQSMESKDGQSLYISLDGEEFHLSVSEVQKVLDSRMRKAESALETTNKRIANTKHPNSNTGNSSGIDYSAPGFAKADTSEFDTPITGWMTVGNQKNSIGALYETSEVAGQAGVAGYASGEAVAYSPVYHGSSWDYLNIQYNGEYKATGLNALGSSELLLEFFVETEYGNVISQTSVLYESQFIGDLWVDEDDFSNGTYIPSVPSVDITIGMRATLKCAAVGLSYTTISASSLPGSGEYDGTFKLDEYIIPEHSWS